MGATRILAFSVASSPWMEFRRNSSRLTNKQFIAPATDALVAKWIVVDIASRSVPMADQLGAGVPSSMGGSSSWIRPALCRVIQSLFIMWLHLPNKAHQ